MHAKADDSLGAVCEAMWRQGGPVDLDWLLGHLGKRSF
jgi:hypothetical protein